MAADWTPDNSIRNAGQTVCPKCGRMVNVSDVPPFTIVDCKSCKARFAAPGKIGECVLLGPLDHGEIATVYRGFDTSMSRHVAVKVMRKELCDHGDLVKAFLAEARALASLDGRNVARVFLLDQENGVPFIVMELIDGTPLEKLFTSERPLAETLGVRIAIDVASALAAATKVGVVHGNVKPGNIIVDRGGRAKLADFGISRLGGGRVAEDNASAMPYYVAPEQISGGETDFRTDIYSLGATMFHALAGSPPFAGAGAEEVRNARMTRPARYLLDLCPSLHRETANVISRMLQADPNSRHPDCQVLLADLNRALRASRKPKSQKAMMLDSARALAKLDRTAPRTVRPDSPGAPAPEIAPLPLRWRGPPYEPAGPARTRWPRRRLLIMATVAVLAGAASGVWYFDTLSFAAGSGIAIGAEVDPRFKPLRGKVIHVDSRQDKRHAGSKAVDGRPGSFWHTDFRKPPPPPPHEIRIDLGAQYELAGFTYLPRQDNCPHGRIARFEFHVSNNPGRWGRPKCSGSFHRGKKLQRIVFTSPTVARYIRLVALSEVNGGPSTSIAELNVLAAKPKPRK